MFIIQRAAKLRVLAPKKQAVAGGDILGSYFCMQPENRNGVINIFRYATGIMEM